MRTARQRTGAEAEQQACDHLAGNGLKVVDRNVRYRLGELDIVATDGERIVFVEVRRRADGRFGGAAASVDRVKRGRLVRAAQIYLQRRYGERWPPCRFDVMAIERGRLEWIIDAFGSQEER